MDVDWQQEYKDFHLIAYVQFYDGMSAALELFNISNDLQVEYIVDKLCMIAMSGTFSLQPCVCCLYVSLQGAPLTG